MISRRKFLTGALVVVSPIPAVAKASPVKLFRDWLNDWFWQRKGFTKVTPLPESTPLHFGSMAWRPELTLVMPKVRRGRVVAQPAYRHVQSLPILRLGDYS